MFAVIPAGGSGTRLWPLSRSADPKFLHDLTGEGRSLLQATYSRLAPVAGPDRTYVVTGGAHAAAVVRQLPGLPAGQLLVEPAPRDSAPAIGLAATLIGRRDPRAVMGSFAADHVVRDEPAFLAAVRAAFEVAEQGYLMTIGIAPTRPDTGYGYLRLGAPLAEGQAYLLEEFKEKPSQAVAEAYLADGRYLWNASMFVWRVDVFLDELQRQQPALHAGLARIADAWDGPAHDEMLGTIWPTLPRVSVDYAVMEDAAARGRVATVPGDFGWHDIGDWDSLAAVHPTSPDGNIVLGSADQYLALDTHDTVIAALSGRLVATLGVSGLVVVDTDQAVLVCSRERAQDVRQLVAALRGGGHGDLG
ncbi:MAG: sugar phosphate nucleotidyltransferase [Actinomycetota bacterium]|nr:sugar phosphate nucleotidyltransferase [Actinomycetota bacterium]